MLNLSKIAALGTLLGLSALAAAPVSASPTTFVFSGLGSGLVLVPGAAGTGNGFTDAAFSFSYATDTDYLNTVGGGLYSTQANAAPVLVSIAGFGSGISTNPLYFSFLPSSNILGLTDSVTGSKVFFVQSSTPAGSGPVAITLADRNQYPLSPFETSIGKIQFADIHNATFSGSFAPVPEASSVISLALLLTLGAGSLTVAARRKKSGAVGLRKLKTPPLLLAEAAFSCSRSTPAGSNPNSYPCPSCPLWA